MNTPRGMANPFVGLCVTLLAFSCAPQHLAAQAAPEQAAPAAAAPTPAEQQPAAVIKKESRLVLVDAVVTDKKGNYIRDRTERDFKVYEDNKEQPVASFSSGTDASLQAKGSAQKRYLILFFD